MKTEFNVIPEDYELSALSVLKARCARFFPLIIVIFCAAEFLVITFFMAPRLKSRFDGALSRMKASGAEAERLAERCAELRGQLQLWNKMLEEGAQAVPALELLNRLKGALPPTAELQGFSAGREILQVRVLFADPQSPDLFLRKMGSLPYGPLRPLERRVASGGALYLRFEASRK